MIILLSGMLALYAAGIVLPLCCAGRPRVQNGLAHGLAAVAGLAGIVFGSAGLLAPEPFALSLPSTFPLLSFAIRLDPLAAFFVATISLAGLSVSVYALGYVTEFYGRASISVLGSLFNGFLLSMTLVVIAGLQVRLAGGGALLTRYALAAAAIVLLALVPPLGLAVVLMGLVAALLVAAEVMRIGTTAATP